MTAMNPVVEGATYALTHRCTLRKLSLTPLTPVVHEGIAWLLCVAAEQTEVRVHSVVVMPNHIHLVLTATRANLSEFKRRFFGEVGKFVKVSLAAHGFEPPERVFAEGAGHHERLIGVAAQLTALHYVDVNTVKAGLVERVEHYPGLSSDLGLMNGGSMLVRPPPLYVDRRRQPEQRDLAFSAPPDLLAQYGSARQVVYELRRLRRDKERALAAARKRSVLGALAVAQQHPWSEPRSPRRFRRGPKPSFLVVGDDELRRRCALETRAIRRRYRGARLALRAGEHTVFPYGTNQLRLQHGVTVEPVEATADWVVNAPGPLSAGRMSRDARRALHTELRAQACTVADEEVDDDLATRLDRARGDVVDRQDAPSVRIEPLDAHDADSPKPGEQRRKLVVLRGSTATARRRRRAQRPADADGATPDAFDVEPPFD